MGFQGGPEGFTCNIVYDSIGTIDLHIIGPEGGITIGFYLPYAETIPAVRRPQNEFQVESFLQFITYRISQMKDWGNFCVHWDNPPEHKNIDYLGHVNPCPVTGRECWTEVYTRYAPKSAYSLSSLFAWLAGEYNRYFLDEDN